MLSYPIVIGAVAMDRTNVTRPVRQGAAVGAAGFGSVVFGEPPAVVAALDEAGC